MGCGGSKHDVATGNIVTRRSILRRASSVGRRNKTSSASKENVDAGMPSNKQVIVNDQANGGASAQDSSEEYFSPRHEMESFELAAAGSEGAEYLSVNGDAEVASAAGGDQEEKASERSGEVAPAAVDKMKNATPPETREEKEEEEQKVVIATTKEDGESIGKHSADFKEAIPIEEPEAEPANKEESEKDSGESRIVTR